MTDRELLELASKAAGIKGFRYVNNEPIQGGYRTGLWSDLYEDCWNPLTDDGDALRLAVKLSMNVVVKTLPHSIYVEAYNWQAPAVVETLADVRGKDFDPYSATRRAITRAAAEIGRNMK